jgi:hypothetical protein
MKLLLLAIIATLAYGRIGAFEELASITGLWKMETSKGTLFEEWKAGKEGTLVSRSFRVAGGDTTFLENVTVQKSGNGLYFIPTVVGENNNQPVTFKMIPSADHTFTFENKQHDYPQRVIYHFVNNDSITARIEGTVNGNFKSSDFYYARVK